MTHSEFLEPFERLLAATCPPATVRSIEAGSPAAPLWDALAASGFLDALVPEAQGGAGLALAEAGPLLQAIGAHAVPLPLGETMIARALLARSGEVAPQGPVALVTAPGGAQPVSGGMVAQHLLVDTGEALVLVDAAALALEPTGVHRSLAARIGAAGGQGSRIARPAAGLRPVAAVLRAALIAGASGRLLAMACAHANDRVQFGKPIARQQAVQQNLAVMAQDVVAARIAAEMGCAAGIELTVATAAAAKSVASSAAARIAAAAHAVHGAIGISDEFDLQLYTRRLHEWRLADGSEGYWNAMLGSERLAAPEATLDWVRRAVRA